MWKFLNKWIGITNIYTSFSILAIYSLHNYIYGQETNPGGFALAVAGWGLGIFYSFAYELEKEL